MSSHKTAAVATNPGVDWQHPARGISHIKDAQQGIIESLMPDGVTPRRKFAIVGFATSSRDDAPFHDPDWDIWALNQVYRHVPRIDRHYEIHHNWYEHNVEGTDHEGWMKTCPVPVVMNVFRPEFPTCVAVPIERLIEKFSDYYTSTIAYMLAMAIDQIDRLVDERVKATGWTVTEGQSPVKFIEKLYGDYSIGIWGVDLIVGTEYFDQKACVEYYCGQAAARGINVGLPKASALCKQTHRYGYELGPKEFPIKKAEVTGHIQQLNKQREELLKQLYSVDGALQANEKWLQLIELRERAGWLEATII